MSNYTFLQPSRIQPAVWGAVLWAALLGRKRSPREDGLAVRSGLRPAVSVAGRENLPASGPYVVVANHLNGPGVWVGVAAALIAAGIGDRSPDAVIRGVGVAAYRDFKIGFLPVPDGVTDFLFGRFYEVYGIIRMPRVTEGASARSGAVRAILSALRQGHIVLLFPEGRNVDNFRMRLFQPGVGDLIRLAGKAGAPAIPVAVAPVDGTFSVTFLPAMVVEPLASRERIEAEMGKIIAAALPVELRGAYG